MDGVLPGHAHGYGRILPSKTLRNVPAFAQAYARANTQVKEKVGGVIPEMGVTSILLPRQNGNGLLSCLRFCPGIWVGCFAWAPGWGSARASGGGFARALG